MATGFKHLNSTFKYIIPNFSGRLSYDDFSMAGLWCMSIMLLPILFVLPVIPFINGMSGESLKSSIAFITVTAMIFFIAGLVSWLSICVRRLHDTGRSGHWIWLTFVNVLNIIPMFLMLGDSVSDNSYGPGTGKSENRTFEDLKKAFHDIVKPCSDRLTYKEFALSCVILGCISSIVFVILYVISLVIMIIAGFAAFSQNTVENLNNWYTDPSMMTSITIVVMLLIFFVLVYGVFFVRLCIRRLHDTGRSGLQFLWALIPIIGICIPLIQIFCDTDDDNQWGPDKRNTTASDFEQCAVQNLELSQNSENKTDIQTADNDGRHKSEII